ncbi:hypothetical protein [Leptolyngbya sp. FACHB-711]|uniref:hypothetical protein n=1 Tax=Leptolyngbya sp. FACHB-711 TaxID=2692813 RepID=UPI0016846C12|nr:hypothetical protein [Leptolyngbya sp. FACHB-711]MBD2028200.1 hypothetical protein [Leptolyngbya sp. FACHB-711]
MMRYSSQIVLAALLALPFAGAIASFPSGIEAAQAANRVQLSVSPGQSRYPRGTDVRVTTKVLGNNSRPIAGAPLLIQEIFFNSARQRTEQRTITSTTTNHEGAFTLNYRVPEDPNKDKVTLVFVNPVANGGSNSWVIPIGR